MPIEILMPALSPTMTEGNLAKWIVAEGDSIKAGDVIAEIETDKATMEVEAVDEGTIGKIIVADGTDNVPVNQLIALLLIEGEAKSALDSYTNAAAQQPLAILHSPLAGESENAPAFSGGGALANDQQPTTNDTPKANIPTGVIEILMPALSPTMTEGNFAKWTVKEGDKIEAGMVIAEIETDKATMEVEAVDEGIIGKLLVKDATENVAVNTPIAALLTDGANKKILKDYIPTSLNITPAPAPTDASASDAPAANITASNVIPAQAGIQGSAGNLQNSKTTAPQPPAATITRSARTSASPVAKRLASNAGINLATISGTGPKGRIIKHDVENHIAGNAAVSRDNSEWQLHKNTGMRKVIAKRLVESKQQVPHFYLSVDCQLDAMLDIRKQLNSRAAAAAGKDAKPAYKLSVNDLVIKATALAMRDIPASNASWYDDSIVQYNNVDISIAVAIDGGLVTPVLKNADQKSLISISNEVKALAAKARNGSLMPEEMQGGGFSISNLGMFGIKTFSAIINPPQSCILAVGAGTEQVIVKNGQPAIATIMTVTLSVDHRSVDGAVGAQFLQAFQAYIENPVTMLV